MKPPSASAKRAAQLVVEQETRGLTEPGQVTDALQGTVRRLSELMANVVGPLGFRAVVVRALHVVQKREPWCEEVSLELAPGVQLAGLADCVARVGLDDVRAGVVSLLAEIIGLHCTFIGEDLTFRLLRRVWRDLPGRVSSTESEES